MRLRRTLLLALLAAMALLQVACTLGGAPAREPLPVPEQHQKENDAGKAGGGHRK